MKQEMVRVAAVQYQHKASDKAYNFSRIEHFVNEAVKQEVQIVSFPEACITGYWHVPELSEKELADLSEPVPNGSSTNHLLRLSKESNVIIGAGLIERSRGKFYNTFVVTSPDGKVHKHRKLHAFEGPHMSSGNTYTVFDTHVGARLGILTCYDNNIPENARMTARKGIDAAQKRYGIDILLAPHQTGGTKSLTYGGMRAIDPTLWENRERDPEAIEKAFIGPSGAEFPKKFLPTRAWDYGFYVVFSNGVGLDNGEVRTGNSMIIDPAARIMVETNKAGDDMVIADIDLSVLPNSNGWRKTRALRPELLKPLTHPMGIEVDAMTARFT